MNQWLSGKCCCGRKGIELPESQEPAKSAVPASANLAQVEFRKTAVEAALRDAERFCGRYAITFATLECFDDEIAFHIVNAPQRDG